MSQKRKCWMHRNKKKPYKRYGRKGRGLSAGQLRKRRVVKKHLLGLWSQSNAIQSMVKAKYGYEAQAR